jgi:hypothetical protein
MLIWGSGGGAKDIKDTGTKFCPTCETARPFKLMVQYKTAHVYYCKWVSSKQYLNICTICSRGEVCDTKETEKSLEKPVIPLWDRRGWLIPATLIAITFLFVISLSLDKNDKTEAYLKSPQIGDLYVVNLAKMFKKTEQDKMYSLLKVVEVRSDGLVVQISNTFYDKVNRPTIDIEKKAIVNENYFSDTNVLLTNENIKKFIADSAINQVVR